MSLVTGTVLGPAFAASYFINGDSSGLSDEELRVSDEWLARVSKGLRDFGLVGCGEPFFSWSFGSVVCDEFLTQYGGELVEYEYLFESP